MTAYEDYRGVESQVIIRFFIRNNAIQADPIVIRLMIIPIDTEIKGLREISNWSCDNCLQAKQLQQHQKRKCWLR